MKRLLLSAALVLFSWSSLAATPTASVEKAYNEIIAIAQAKEVAPETRKEQLESVIKQYVDLQAASQRVLATHWKKANKDEKVAFMRVFRKVLTNTYFNLLQNYTNEKVIFLEESIKKKKYATVESKVISGGTEIPITFRLLKRKDGEWKLYDFVAEGISMIRSFSTDYQAILRKDKVAGLINQLEAKVAQEPAA